MKKTKTTDTELPRRTTVPYDVVRQLHTSHDWINAWHDLCEAEEPTEAALMGLLHVAFEKGRLSDPEILRILISVAMVEKYETDNYTSVRERLRMKACSVINTRFLKVDHYNWKSIHAAFRSDMTVIIELLHYLIARRREAAGNHKHMQAFISDLRIAVYRSSRWPFMASLALEGDYDFGKDLREYLRGHEDLFIQCCGSGVIRPHDDDFREALRRWVFRPDEATKETPTSIKDALLFPGREKAVAALVRSDSDALKKAQLQRSQLTKQSRIPERKKAIHAADSRTAQIKALAFKPPQ